MIVIVDYMIKQLDYLQPIIKIYYKITMSKAEIIANAEAEIYNTSSYQFSTLRADLKKRGIDESEPIMKTIDILKNQTFETYSAKKQKLNQKSIKKLKILSILSHFYERESYDLNKLSKQLSATKEDCINLLLQASINKLITVKINEQANKILIINSKIRQREIGPQIVDLCKDKLLLIKQKNNQVENNLINLINIADPFSKDDNSKPVESYQKLLASFRHRH